MTQPRDAKGRFVSRPDRLTDSERADLDAAVAGMTLDDAYAVFPLCEPPHPADAIRPDTPCHACGLGKPCRNADCPNVHPADAISAEPQIEHRFLIGGHEVSMQEFERVGKLPNPPRMSREPHPAPEMREEGDDESTFWLWFVVAVMFVMLVILGWELF